MAKFNRLIKLIAIKLSHLAIATKIYKKTRKRVLTTPVRASFLFSKHRTKQPFDKFPNIFVEFAKLCANFCPATAN